MIRQYRITTWYEFEVHDDMRSLLTDEALKMQIDGEWTVDRFPREHEFEYDPEKQKYYCKVTYKRV
jgi:hypothetical protein